MGDSSVAVASLTCEFECEPDCQPSRGRVWRRLALLVLAAAALWLLAGLTHTSKAAAEAPPPVRPIAATVGSVDQLLVPHRTAPVVPAPAAPVAAAPVRAVVAGMSAGVRTTVAGVVHTVDPVVVDTVQATGQNVVEPVIDRVVTSVLTPAISILPPAVHALPPVAVLDPSTIESVLPIEHLSSAPAEATIVLTGSTRAAVAAGTVGAALVSSGSDQVVAAANSTAAASKSAGIHAGTALAAPSAPTQPTPGSPTPGAPTPGAPTGSVALSVQPGGPLLFLTPEVLSGARLAASGRARLATQAANPKNTADDPAFSPD